VRRQRKEKLERERVFFRLCHYGYSIS
jgi:hypothetical protein